MCDADDRVRFVRQTPPMTDTPRDEGQPALLTTTYGPLVDELAVGNRVMLADGTVSLVVEETGPDFAECRVVQPGLIRSRQGVNLPGVKLSAAALGPADREKAVWAAQAEVDFVGLSFVRTADEVRQLKQLLQSHDSPAQVIAKIEKPEAVENLEEILAAADGLMVARGDLGVEIDIAEVAVVQKQIIEVCQRRRKPAIIATQMLDSMQHSRLPTRAEVTDVANAILDGADACMLSGETAVGDHPRLAVEMMHRIAVATETHCRRGPPRPLPELSTEGVNPITETTVYAAGRMAEQLGAKILVVASSSGATALSVAKNRHAVPTIGVSDDPVTLRRMCLYWGVIPLAGAPTRDHAALLRFVVERGKEAGLLAAGDRIVLVAGSGISATAHNMIVVHVVE
jgi:pyruvate kinase